MADYYPVLANSVSGLGNNTPEARQQLYQRARAALVGLTSSELELARERLALEMAVVRIEEERASASQASPRRTAETARDPAQNGVVVPPARAPSPLYQCHTARKDAAKLHPASKRASTLLLIASMFFPGLWALDATSMSMYWVARGET
jgi:hypothetical protein